MRALDVAAPPAALLATFSNFVSYHGYSWLAPEILGLTAALVAAGLLLRGLMAASGRALSAACLAAAIAFSVDVAADRKDLVFPLTFAAVLVVAWLLRARFLPIAGAALVALVAGNLLLPVGTWPLVATREFPTEPAREDLPPVIHLVLDSHIGIEGIPRDVEGGREAVAMLRRFYETHGFRLYGRAFSRYARTVNSLPNLLNLSAETIDHAFFEKGPNRKVLLRNRYFVLMSELGYRIRVYQPRYRDLCRVDGVRYAACQTHSQDTIKTLETSSLDTDERAVAIAISYINHAASYLFLRNLYQHGLRPWLERIGAQAPDWDWNGGWKIGPLSVPKILENLAADIKKGARGRLFFAHLFIPHCPYVFDERCQLYRSPRERLTASSALARMPAKNTPQTRREGYERYLRQMHCQQTLLERFFSQIELNERLRDAVVIIHGDHGSTLVLHRPLIKNESLLVPQDYVDSFSVLFAARAPGIEPGYDSRMLGLEQLLADALRRGVGADVAAPTEGEEAAFVFLVDREWEAMQKRPMVPFGVAHGP